MGDLVEITDFKEHDVSEVICLKCYKRWIDVRPSTVWLKDLQCPKCKETGYVINTGQILELDEVE